VICFNDDAAIGALAAAAKLKREQDVVIVGQGADRRVRSELRKSGSRIICSTAYWPEHYGEKLIDAALRILRGEPVPPAVYIDHTLITPDNIDQFYPEEQKN
jgi:ribose transport system substrate-binding protein